MPTRRILVIDNELMVQEVAQISLETIAGWRVITASSGREGLAKAETEQPDAILLDVMMPDMDGITTFKQLRGNSATQSIPVILLTAKMQSDEQQHYTELGLNGAIAKPFDPMTLASEMAQILGWSV